MSVQVHAANAALVAVLANLLEGDVCFLCYTSSSAECVWDEIGNDIMGHGWAAGIAYEDRNWFTTMPLSLAKFHKACHYGCYHQYIFTVSSWCCGMGCIHIPACVEAHIRRTFPSDGVFVGFQANNNDE